MGMAVSAFFQPPTVLGAGCDKDDLLSRPDVDCDFDDSPKGVLTDNLRSRKEADLEVTESAACLFFASSTWQVVRLIQLDKKRAHG